MTDTQNTAPELKRHEWKLLMANLLRDEINEVLARYDVPSSVYEADVCIAAVKAIVAAIRAEAEE
jgi:hypothetical protein